MIQEICTDPIFLGRKAEPATPADLAVAQDLVDTLTAHKEGCVGMAANMIGVNKRIIIFDNDGSYCVMFNPTILKATRPYETEEGCLSLPDKWGVTDRPETVCVRALDRNGKEFTVTASGLGARAFCHELDHLEGVLFTDNALRMLSPEELEN